MKAGFLIAAPTSGSGKTTIARGLMSLYTLKGYKVQPFKCGPDYIDTKFHAAVCQCPSINLDTFMATAGHVRELFCRYGADADVRIVEGMMGLFDGYDRDAGSSAEIARTLSLPVVLVVDAKSAAYSMAALISGFANFRPDVRIAGVIFNRVGSERHFAMLRQVCNDIGIECFGYLPKNPALEQGSRYLGLDFSERPETIQLVELLEKNVNWQRLLELMPGAETDFKPASPSVREDEKDGKRTLVALNGESFSFIYQENIDSLKNVEFFNPETDVPCLDDVDLLYLPGGYPEKHLQALVDAEATRQAIKDYAERGGRIIAECGGMMYLCKAIVTDDGEFPMCGVLPYCITARKADLRLSLGYRRFILNGREFRGHEFHYTRFLGETPQSSVQVLNAKGEPVDTPIIRYKNVLASYTHLYEIK
ncbi:MAG: cobyrinate a,c-diamide synthase [Muribaculaceae bacterium]|nr:cobyrinate a,c-diamide synthase [Muribaculaceae bacterium]